MREVGNDGARFVHALEARLQPVELALGDAPARLQQLADRTRDAQRRPFARLRRAAESRIVRVDGAQLELRRLHRVVEVDRQRLCAALRAFDTIYSLQFNKLYIILN